MMGKGGSDRMVCGRLLELMRGHPYDPKVSGNDTPEPYLLDDAIMELYPKLTQEELVRVLFYNFGDQPKVQLSGGEMPAGQALDQLTLAVMAVFAKQDETLMALNGRRNQLYRSLRGPKVAL